MLEIPLLAEQLLGSQERPSSMELVSAPLNRFSYVHGG
jgi:hypothetical protein